VKTLKHGVWVTGSGMFFVLSNVSKLSVEDNVFRTAFTKTVASRLNNVKVDLREVAFESEKWIELV
jgi:hypothetical protein